MRFNPRIVKSGFTFFTMIAKHQLCEGVTTEVIDVKHNPPLHYVFADLENCSQGEAEDSLRFVQNKYGLSDIFMVSDLSRSYRAWCFSTVDFTTYRHILLDIEYLDYSFFYYTVKRRAGTLRTSCKKGREPQQLVSVLYSYPMPFPNKVRLVKYDTGYEKRGMTILLGDKNG